MKNNIFRVSLVVLLLAMITLSVISGTLAKYVETVYGTDTARVAKFEYTATAGGTLLESKVKATPTTIDLFNTVDDPQVYDPEGHNLNTQKLVAPGTLGHFDIVATNKSEVAVDVTYVIEETNAGNVPIVYFIKDGSTVTYYSNKVTGTTVAMGADVAEYLTGSRDNAANTVTITGDLSDLSTAVSTQLAATDRTTFTDDTSTIGWFWAFGDATNNVDSADTTKGLDGTATVKVDIGVTFTQVD